MYSYETLFDAITDLNAWGYTADFGLSSEALECKGRDLKLKAEDFDIDEFYRFEGDSDPADNTIVYAVSSLNKSIKGTLVHAYGTYSETVDSDTLAKLSTHYNQIKSQ